MSGMRWKNSEEYDRTHIRYIRRRRWRDRFVYRRLAWGAVLLMVMGLAIFITVHYVAGALY
jgi:hypothetical protein